MPPELTTVNDVFVRLLADELGALGRQLQPVISEGLSAHLERVARSAEARRISAFRLFVERSRLIRQWSSFFSSYPIVLGPNLGCPIWPIDADLHPGNGVQLLDRATRFIAPGNALGIPSLALPMGTADGLPTSVLIYADLWREDLCLRAAEIIESAVERPKLVDPSWC